MFRSSRVQTYLTKKLTAYLSNKLNTTVSVKGVDIEFFDKLVLDELLIKDHGQDTLIYVPRFKITLSDLDINQNIIQIGDVILDNAYINIRKFKREGDFNFQFIVDALSGNKNQSTTNKKDPEIFCNHISLRNCRLNYSLLYKKHGTWGIDWDYVKLRNLNINLYSLHTYGDTINTYIKDLSFNEKSGFYISDASFFFKAHSKKMHFKSFKANTKKSKITADVKFTYNSWSDFDEFIEKVKIDAMIKRSKLEMEDLSYFAKELKGISKQLFIQGDAIGTIDNFTANNLLIEFGDKTSIEGKLKMRGLPDAENTLINFRINQLYTCKKDLEGIPLPPFTSKEYLKLPNEINSMGIISYKGDFTGFYNNFVTYGTIKSDIGIAKTDLKINYNLETEITEYSGKLYTQNFNLKKLLNNNNLGYIDANLNIVGKGFTLNSLDARAKGKISSIDFMDYRYKNISLDGIFKNKQFKGTSVINDPNIFLDFDGEINLKNKIPQYNFSATLDRADLNALGLYKRNEPFKISSDMKINVEGNTIDNFIGNISLEDIEVETSTQTYDLGEILINSQKQGDQKRLILASDIMDARLTGQYDLEHIIPSFQKILNHHLPNAFSAVNSFNCNTTENFTFNLKIKDTHNISELFFPNLQLNYTSTINGSINSSNNLLELNAKIPEMVMSGTKLYDLETIVSSSNKDFIVKNTIESVAINDSISFKNIQVQAYPWNNDLVTNINWNNLDKHKNSGQIENLISFTDSSNIRIQLREAKLYVRDTNWVLSNTATMDIDSVKIKFNNLLFTTGTQEICVNGAISKNPSEQLNIKLTHFIIENLNPFLDNYDVTLGGIADGVVNISDLYKKPLFDTELILDEFSLNNENLGKGKVIATYNDERKVVKIEGNLLRGDVPTIKFNGMYFPFKKEDDLEFSVNLHKTQLKILHRFTDGVLSNLKGYATGDLLIIGSSNSPELYGKIELEKGGFKVDYLNTSYSFNGILNITPKAFEVKNADLYDDLGNLSKASFKLSHQSFKDFRFYIEINANKLMCLNTGIKDNNLFYGKAFTSGLIKIMGPPDELKIDIASKTEKGTQLFIPYNYAKEVSENSFVKFVNKKDTDVEIKKIQKTDLTGIQMNFDLEVTPDAQFQMVFDSKVGDVIKGKGEGNVKMEINTNGLFNMYGNFRFTEGDYLFTFENAINKKFKIEPNSIISWNGDPYNASIDITTIYKTKTALATLLQDSSSEYKRNIPVDVLLKLKDNLFNPTISFGINFPTQSNNETLKAQVNSIIGNDNINELNRQVFALLMIGSFIPPAGSNSGATRVQEGIGNTSAELLSAQFNNWISQISKNVNLGLNYKPSSDLTSRQIELAVSTQLFNNRLSIDGNFGVANNQQTAAASSLVDVNVEYKLTNNGKLRLKAYNKPNDYINYFTQGYNKQGVGLIYKEEFYTFSELVNRKRKKTSTDTTNKTQPINLP